MSGTRKRRAPGEGSVYFDASKGVHVGAVSLRDPDTGKRVRRKVSGATPAEVRDKLARLREEKRKTGTVARQDVTVGSAVKALLASPPPGWRSPVTLEVSTVHAGRVIAALGKVRLVKLTPGQVETFLAGMVRDGYSTSTISGTKQILVRAIRRAERDGLVGRNVAQLADTPRGTVRESRSMNLEQIRQLFGSDMSGWWRAYLMVGILCGLRPGELLGLTWDDVDFGAGLIRVRHCLKAVPGPDGTRVLQLEDLKTERSRRTLALPAKAADALRALKAAQAADKLRLGRYYADRGIVFAGNAGQPQWRQNIGRTFKQVCERAGIGGDWHPHEQRHSFVSVLSDAGIDVEAIADAVGHVNSSVTREVYRKQIADKVTHAATAMDQIFGSGSGA